MSPNRTLALAPAFLPALLALAACQQTGDNGDAKPEADPAEAGAAAIEKKANEDVAAKIREIEARAPNIAEKAASAQDAGDGADKGGSGTSGKSGPVPDKAMPARTTRPSPPREGPTPVQPDYRGQ